jgi:hypothetical protein
MRMPHTQVTSDAFLAAFNNMQMDSKLKWPSTIEKATKRVGINPDRAQKHAICPAKWCGAMYPLDKAIEIKRCTRFIEVPIEQPLDMQRAQTEARDAMEQRDDHRDVDMAFHGDRNRDRVTAMNEHRWSIERCNTPLMKPTNHIESAADHEANMALRVQRNPFQLHLRIDIPELLVRHMQRPGVAEKCELWRSRYRRAKGRAADGTRIPEIPFTGVPIEADLMSDIWDGEMWQRYQYLNAKTHRPFEHTTDNADDKEELLAAPGTLALALNVDWFCPTKDGNYSMGAIYMTVLNMPREALCERSV